MQDFDQNSTESAIVDLQIHLAHLEHLLDSLNQTVAQQDREIQDLKRQLQLMYRHFDQQNQTQIAPFDLLADKPPHF